MTASGNVRNLNMSDQADKSSGHIPLRTCLGCRKVKSQRELKRVALIIDDSGRKIVWDEARKLGGRGAWICRDSTDCLSSAIKKRSFSRAFKCGDLDLSFLE